ncbi:MAG: 3-deoxy-D-manno-octulosonic acid transferase [Gammaproteobacteria bacterium]|nr:3-deoxy-D-manno-octulosonic acid transferase [Gammaproteobacteria bacterium]MBU3999061.1 3-deoxy-D-manno-octulosonic acid transferase [Gammaproteobacteria bacterium]MBU4019346.1 3-deoxy-D-manno-octulosonic acid transferase [Gammaproteobacteria bacterium]MBU4081910.1 3-deoxy-D-manno-octulosonic acid transferase [Gammaproteobacteria bacterium]MBU4172617.1 3-deoxy-D-manno-octulosonic acid transferase [Gammaproteobacteria bacterium]
MWLAQPLLRLKLRRRGVQEPGYLLAMDEHFGHYTSAAPPADGHTIWVHAVSLGETRAAAVLVTSLRARLPGMRLLLTHGTATGRAEGLQLLLAGDLQVWQPWDTAGAVQRFLAHFQPRIGILMETEIWPNLVAGCAQRRVPLVLANARLSAQSQRKTRRLAWLARPAYRALSAVWAQTQDDGARLASLGAPVQGIFGNLKFDATPNAEQLALGQRWRRHNGRPVVMLASSREGEEADLLQLLASFWPLARVDNEHAAIVSVVNEVQWLIVPRHPQRFAAVAALIEQQAFGVSLRSSWLDGPQPGRASADASSPRATVWLGDSLGEMALYYGLADVALLGGSFEPLGGQNLIEAAACGCPVVMGPHTFNFADAAEQARVAGAAQRVADITQGVQAAARLAVDANALAVAQQAAKAFARSHCGASARLTEAVVQLLADHPIIKKSPQVNAHGQPPP